MSDTIERMSDVVNTDRKDVDITSSSNGSTCRTREKTTVSNKLHVRQIIPFLLHDGWLGQYLQNIIFHAYRLRMIRNLLV